MFSWGGLTDRDHMHGPPMARWKFVTLVIVWTVAVGAILVWIAP
jgi:hypothetical protein